MKPRERMLESGERSLSDEELIAILLRTGSNGQNVLELAREVLGKFGSLSSLSDATVEELTSVKGIGVAKATSLKAALELGKRLHEELVKKPKRIRSPEDVVRLCHDMRYETREVVRVFAVDNSLSYISHRDYSSSLGSMVEISRRDVLRYLVRVGASAFFMAHNHPSNSKPSPDDIEMTKKLLRAGKIVGIELVDHVIIAPDSFTSLKREGLI